MDFLSQTSFEGVSFITRFSITLSSKDTTIGKVVEMSVNLCYFVYTFLLKA